MMARNTATTGSTGSATMPITISAKMAIGRSKIDCASPPVTVPRTEPTSRKYSCHDDAGRDSNARSGRASIEFSKAPDTPWSMMAPALRSRRERRVRSQNSMHRKKKMPLTSAASVDVPLRDSTRSYTCSRKIEGSSPNRLMGSERHAAPLTSG